MADSRGLLLGTALYSPTSQIALRLVSREAIGEAEWLELLAERLRGAICAAQADADRGRRDACRLCFSEADELPGLVVDKYGELVILQLLTKGLDSAAVRDVCVRVLREELRSGCDSGTARSAHARVGGTVCAERPRRFTCVDRTLRMR